MNGSNCDRLVLRISPQPAVRISLIYWPLDAATSTLSKGAREKSIRDALPVQSGTKLLFSINTTFTKVYPHLRIWMSKKKDNLESSMVVTGTIVFTACLEEDQEASRGQERASSEIKILEAILIFVQYSHFSFSMFLMFDNPSKNVFFFKLNPLNTGSSRNVKKINDWTRKKTFNTIAW